MKLFELMVSKLKQYMFQLTKNDKKMRLKKARDIY